jgi:peptidoglycan glycosyltransferase
MTLFVRSAALLAAVLVILYGLYQTSSQAGGDWLVVMAVTFVLIAVTFWPNIPQPVPTMERSLIRVATLFFVGFIMISIQLVRIQIVDSAAILAHAGTGTDGTVIANPRERIRESEVARGRILARGGEVIAETTEQPDGTQVRSYPEPAAGDVVGFYSPLLYGTSNLESAYDVYLSGEKGGNLFTEWFDELLHRPQQGYDVTIALDLALQQQADEFLGDQRGAAVLMDATTGTILAMASKPGFDPNQLYVSSGPNAEQQTERARAYWEQLSEPGDSLVFRPTQGLYAPGSIFKTVTLAASLETGLAAPDTVYRDEGALTVDSRVIVEHNRPNPNLVRYTLTEAYGYSLNVVFAQVGLQLGPERLAEYAQRFGFGEVIPFDLPVSPSKVSSSPEFLSNQSGLADTAFGQGQLLVTPLQMAEVAGAVVNDGEMMRPTLLDHISSPTGETLQERDPDSWQRAIEPETARQVREIMIDSVENGYASGASIPGYVVGGKTGTAEAGGERPHAWFIGFAGEDEPRYVVAVVVEHGGEGGSVALPIGRELLQAALQTAQP